MSSLAPGAAFYSAIARLRQRFDHHRKRKLDDLADAPLAGEALPLAASAPDSYLDDPLRHLKMPKPDSDDSSSSFRVPATPSSSSRVPATSFSSSPSCFSPKLQFFVRLMSRTVVIHAAPNDTVDLVIDRIRSLTGIPAAEQRLIYRGRQLQGDATLAACALENDASLYLTGRLRSTKHPRAWQVVNDLVSAILSLDGIPIDWNADAIQHKRDAVERLIKEFLNMSLVVSADHRPDETAAHLEVFTEAGAASALVKLYLSPIPANRAVAKSAIGIFLAPNPDFLPEYVHVQWAPILLDLCRMLAGTVGRKDELYTSCRSALSSLLDAGGGARYLTNLKPADVVQEIHLFIGELTESVLSGLMTEFMLVAPSVLTDLSNFLSAMRWVATEWKDINGGSATRRLSLSRQMKCEEWIASLHGLFIKFLRTVDQCLKRVEDFMQQKGQAQSESRLAVWAQLVVVLTVVNAFAKIFDGGEQLLHAVLLERRVPLNFLLRRAKRNEKLRWFLKHKDVTDFEARKNLVLMLLPEGKDEDELHEMLIDRSQLLAESFEYIGQVEAISLHGGLFMEFKNEEATGPGVLREWFCLLCRMIFNPQNVLFLPCANDRRRFYPNPASAVDPLHLKYFNFSGRVIALALMHKVHVGIVFDRTFFLQLAGKPITLEDVRDADPCLYLSCKRIMEMDADVLDSDALGLTFVREIEELGSKRTVELCPGGKDLIVNSKNREEYVNHLIQHCFVTSVSEQVAHFSQGFADILSDSKHQKFFFQSLDIEDFDRMLGGSDNVIDVKEWKAHTEYNGYKAKDRQISWFWKIVEGMTEEQRRILLFFWTSVKFLPVDGFGSLASKLYIYKSSSSQDSLPTSHTCFYRLCLPPYRSKSVMFDRLQLITQEHVSCSFGLW